MYLSCTTNRPVLESTQLPTQMVQGTVHPWVKQLGSESDLSPPPSVEVKIGGALPVLSHISSCILLN
jgi:hypothetical protein